MKDRVLLVGSFPPPFGGCSVHTMRLREALRGVFSVNVIDLYGARTKVAEPGIVRCGNRRPLNAIRAVLQLLQKPASLVHFHVAGMDAFLYAAYPMLAVLGRGTGKIVTIHSGSFIARFEHGPAWRRLLLRDLLRRFDRIVAVNQDQKTYLEQIGLDRKRIVVIPAFLPPMVRESPRVVNAIKALKGCSRIILSSGYGVRYYGFELIMDALDSVESKKTDLGLILCLYNSYDEAFVDNLERRFVGGIPGCILRDLPPEEFAWLLARCDVYVRATDRDGDAVAIREAQFFGKAVIASDCVERPSNVKLFVTNNSISLARAIEEVDTSPATRTEDGGAGLTALLDVYQKVLCA